MRIAVIADIHGNSAALDAVLADIARIGVDLTVNLGDSLSGPLDGRGTADRLLDANLPTVMGNHDRWLVDRPFAEMGSWEVPVFPTLDDVHLDWIRAIPATAEVEGVFLCHGTPTSDTENWLDIRANGGMSLAPRTQIEAHAAGIAAEAFVCAHTHVPRLLRLRDGRLVMNPGSVGCPGYADPRPPEPCTLNAGSPDARYGVMERIRGSWHGTLRAVPYDASEMIGMARAAGQATWVSVLESGWAA